MIETMFVKLKSSGRVATKYDYCAHTFMSAIHIAASFTFYLEESVLRLDGHPAWRASVVDHCTFRFSANYALQLQVTHQTHSYTPGNRNTLAMQPQPDFPNTIDTEMLVEDAKDFGVKASFPPFTYGPMLRVASCPQLLLVGQWDDLQQSTDRQFLSERRRACPICARQRMYEFQEKTSSQD